MYIFLFFYYYKFLMVYEWIYRGPMEIGLFKLFMVPSVFWTVNYMDGKEGFSNGRQLTGANFKGDFAVSKEENCRK